MRTAIIATRFVPTLIITAWATLIILLRLWLLRTLRLDAAQGAAQFFQFAFVGELLAVGDFDEF